jgi:DNA-binding CsgD family transcriptional regulator
MQPASPQDQFLDTLYSAALGATGWKPALAAFASMIDAPIGNINVHFPDRIEYRHAEILNTPESFSQRSRDYWMMHDPWVRQGYLNISRNPSLLRNGFVLHGASEVPTNQFLNTAWYRDFGREYYLQDCLSLSATSGGMVVTISGLTGSRDLRLFSDEQIGIARRTLSQFRRAVGLHSQLARRQTIDSANAKWGTSTLPVIMLRASRIIHANAAADAELERNDLIARLPGNGIRILDPSLADLAKTHERAATTAQATLVATAQNGERWLAQLIRINQLAGSLLAAAGADDPAVLMILTPLDINAAGRAKVLQSLSLLTPTEREIASQLLCGDSVEAVARHRRLSTETVRWHIRNMIGKTGARNLADLHRILALLLPL